METELDITAYVIPLDPVTSFKYLGIFLFVVDEDCPDVVKKLQRAKQKWARMTRVLSKEGEDARTPG